MGEITVLLGRAREGDKAALDALFERLHEELRQVAHRRLAGHRREGGVDTTALVNECYLKLSGRDTLSATDRAHLLGYAATVRRSIIVDAARAARTERRGGGAQPVTLDTELMATLPDPVDEILDVHAALDELRRIDERLVRVVEMRFFAGLNDEAIAEALGITDRTVRRHWAKARLLLSHALRG